MSVEGDRRAPGATRFPFQATVEVGGAIGPAFEATAVNVSQSGMLLQTTYLPEVGHNLSCRFETGGQQSVLASGEVVWRQEGEKGGEFAIRFTDLDADSEEALRKVTQITAGRASGTKVRLHIEGLAQPMRMHIREEGGSKMRVESDLGFLQVGKHLELEDAGLKRPATIDRVEVEVDPESRVPQLVVSLKYDDVEGEYSDQIGGTKESTPDPTVTDTEEPSDAAHLEGAAMKEEDIEIAEESEKMRGTLAKGARKVAPVVSAWANRAKTAISIIAAEKWGKKWGGTEEKARRVTAAPPGGGLHAEGRRVVRSSMTDEAAIAKSPKFEWTKKNITIASTVAGVVLLGAIALKKPAHPPSEIAKTDVTKDDAKDPTATTDTAGVTTTTNATVPAPVGVIPTAYPQPPAAFGAPVGTPNTYGAVGSTPTGNSFAPDQGAMSTGNMPGLLAPANEPTVMPEEHVTSAHKGPFKVTPFGDKGLTHGNVLRLKMDGAIESIQGASQGSGFTVVIPHRRSLEPASPLASKDSRIASMKVTNEGQGAELSVMFHDGVPNYLVRAKGDTLEIVLQLAKSDSAPNTATTATHTTATKVHPRSKKKHH